MKTSRKDSLFTARKKPRIDNNEYWLPEEIWEIIFGNLDKRSSRHVSQVSSVFRRISKNMSEAASWPAVDYRLYLPKRYAKSTFKWQRKAPLFNGDVAQPVVSCLKNGDVSVAMEDGRLIVLRCRTSEWKMYGKHEKIDEDGTRYPRSISQVISFRANEIASCGTDGIRIWDNQTATQKYLLTMPPSCSWVASPTLLLKLPHHRFASGSWDGSVHLWSLSEEDRYEYRCPVAEVDAKPAHALHGLSYSNNQILGQFSDFIAAWDPKDGYLLGRMEFSDLKTALLNAVNVDPRISEHNLTTERMSLDFDWAFPEGFVGVCIDDRYWFLVKLFDAAVKPCFLGFQDRMKWRMTTSGDLIVTGVLDPQLIDASIEILGKWNPTTNTFAFIRQYDNLDMEDFFISLDGKIMIDTYEEDQTIEFYNPYDDTNDHLHLSLPRGQSFGRLIGQVKNGDLVGFDKSGAIIVWCAETGKYKTRIQCIGDDIVELPNGDLLTNRYWQYGSEANLFAYDLDVHHFGLRK